MKNTKLFRWQKETQIDFVDPTPPLNKTDPPEFIAPISPSKVVIPGRFLPADTAWSPNFKVKASVGFTPTEHPDRPTLLSELAAERAKEEEEAKSEAAASGNVGDIETICDIQFMLSDIVRAMESVERYEDGVALAERLLKSHPNQPNLVVEANRALGRCLAPFYAPRPRQSRAAWSCGGCRRRGS